MRAALIACVLTSCLSSRLEELKIYVPHFQELKMWHINCMWTAHHHFSVMMFVLRN